MPILLDYVTTEGVLEGPGIESTDPNIPLDNNCTDNEHHFGIPGSNWDYQDYGDESELHDTIPTADQRRLTATELARFDLGTSHVTWCEGEDGNDADADEEEEASPANDGSTQNVED